MPPANSYENATDNWETTKINATAKLSDFPFPDRCGMRATNHYDCDDNGLLNYWCNDA